MFWLFRAKADKKGLAPVYAKLTIEGEDVDISIGRKVSPEYWDEKQKRDLENTREAKLTNQKIDEARIDLERHFAVLQTMYERITPQMLKNRFRGLDAEWSAESVKRERTAKRTLIASAEAYIADMEKMVELGQRVKGTKKNWNTSIKHLKEFVQNYTGSADIPLEEVNKNFASEFVRYMTLYRTPVLQGTSAQKKITHLKAFVEYAVDKQWTERSWIAKFSYTVRPNKVNPLEYADVMKIYHKEFDNPRLERIRDLFIFQCFTGYAYGDFQKLTREHLVDHGAEGGKWLVKDRNKTDETELVPVLPIVEQLIEKYGNDPALKQKGALLPVISNQRYNGYLKEIGTLCNISRELNTHLARHTFAHLMLNVCFLPMEDVGRMLGHSSTRSTARYCQVGKQRVKHNMEMVREQLFDSGGLREQPTRPGELKRA